MQKPNTAPSQKKTKLSLAVETVKQLRVTSQLKAGMMNPTISCFCDPA